MIPRPPTQSGMSVTVSLEAPRPFLNEGPYMATCTEATCAWSRRWSKWICRLVMEPINYTGRPYTGRLCKFLQLGSNPKMPHAGQQSDFLKLLVAVNGAQPVNGDGDLAIFVGRIFKIEVRTVKEVFVGKKEREAAIRVGKEPPEKKPLPAECWYSVVDECQATLEHTNTVTQQHTNTATHQPSNTLTLKNTATPLTQQHSPDQAANRKVQRDLSLGSTQQTHSASPDTGAEGAIVSSVPDDQNHLTVKIARSKATAKRWSAIAGERTQ